MSRNIVVVSLVLLFSLIASGPAMAATCAVDVERALNAMKVPEKFRRDNDITRLCKEGNRKTAALNRVTQYLEANKKASKASSAQVSQCPKRLGTVNKRLDLKLQQSALGKVCKKNSGSVLVASQRELQGFLETADAGQVQNISTKPGFSLTPAKKPEAAKASSQQSEGSSDGDSSSVIILSNDEMIGFKKLLSAFPGAVRSNFESQYEIIKDCALKLASAPASCELPLGVFDSSLYVTRAADLSLFQLFLNIPKKVNVSGGIFDVIGGSVEDVIFAAIPPFSTVKSIEDIDLQGELARSVKDSYNGVIRVDPRLQMLMRMKLDGALPATLQLLGFPFDKNQEYMVRVGVDKITTAAQGSSDATMGTRPRSNAVTEKAKPEYAAINNYYAELRLEKWDEPFGMEGAVLYNGMVFYDTLGNLRLSGHLVMGSRDYYLFLEGPTDPRSLAANTSTASVGGVWKTRSNFVPFAEAEFGLAAHKISMKDVLKISAALNNLTARNATFKDLSSTASSALGPIPDDLLMIENPKMKSYRFPNRRDDNQNAAQHSPLELPSADKFNLLFLASPTAKYEWVNEKGNKKSERGPLFVAFGDLAFLGENFAGVDVHFSTAGLNAHGTTGVNLPVGKVMGQDLGRLSFNAALDIVVNSNDPLVKFSGTAGMGVLGTRELNARVDAGGIHISSPAGCEMPLDLKLNADFSETNLLALMKQVGIVQPDPTMLAECAAGVVLVIIDGAVRIIDGVTQEIVGSIPLEYVLDDATREVLNDGYKIVNGAFADASSEAANAAAKAGLAVADVGEDVAVELASIGSSAFSAGSSAANKVGRQVSRTAKKISCKIGFTKCKKKKRSPPVGIPVRFAATGGSGFDISASGNVADKMWVLGGNYNLYLYNGTTLLHSPAKTASGTQVGNFRKIAIGPKDALLATDVNEKVYFTNGVRDGAGSIEVSQVGSEKAIDVGISTGQAWIIKPDGRVWRSGFNGNKSSLNFSRVSNKDLDDNTIGSASLLDVDIVGNAWIVVDQRVLYRWDDSKSKWAEQPSFLTEDLVGAHGIESITVDKHYRPFVGLKSLQLWALGSDGWERYQGQIRQLSARQNDLWAMGGSRKFYRAPLPEFKPEGPQNDWRYTLITDVGTEEEEFLCAGFEKPTNARPDLLFQPLQALKCDQGKFGPLQQLFMQNVDGDYFRMVSKESGLCLGVLFEEKAQNSTINGVPCSKPDQAQQWKMQAHDDGEFLFKNRETNQCIMSYESGSKHKMRMGDCNQGFSFFAVHKSVLQGENSDPRKFTASNVRPDKWSRQIVNAASGNRCISGNPNYPYAYAYACGGGNENQQFRFVPKSDNAKWIQLINVKSDKCMVPVVNDGVRKVEDAACSKNSVNQYWGVRPRGGSGFNLFHQATGMCLTQKGEGSSTGNHHELRLCDTSVLLLSKEKSQRAGKYMKQINSMMGAIMLKPYLVSLRISQTFEFYNVESD